MDYNTLHLSNADHYVDSHGTGSHVYTLDSAHAEDGVITIHARFIHSDDPPDPPDVGVTFTIKNEITNVIINITNTGDITLNADQSLTITLADNNTGSWYYKTELKAAGNTYLIKGIDYAPGKHQILVIVNKDGVPYSKIIYFTVTN
jgi:hypothetical protein